MLRAAGARLAAGRLRLVTCQPQQPDAVAAACACALRCLSGSAPQLQHAEPAEKQEEKQPAHPQPQHSKSELHPYIPDEGPGADSTIVHKHGADLLHDCVYNKVGGCRCSGTGSRSAACLKASKIDH